MSGKGWLGIWVLGGQAAYICHLLLIFFLLFLILVASIFT